MLHIFSATSFLFITIITGFLFGRFKIFNPESSSTLIRFVFYLALPASLFLSCYQEAISLLNIKYILTYTCAQIIAIIIIFFVSRFMLKENNSSSFLNSLSVSGVNGAYFTIPLLMLVFGSAAAVIPIMFIQNVVFFTILVFCIDVFRLKTNHKKLGLIKFIIDKIRSVLFKNPIILSSILGFIFSLSHIKIPLEVIKFLNFFGSASSPVALFALGLSFSASFSVAWKEHKDKKNIIVLTIGKVLFLPIIAWLLGVFFSLPKEYLLPLVLFCASPAAIHSFIIAHQYKLNEKVQTNVIVLSTIFSFFTTNLILLFL